MADFNAGDEIKAVKGKTKIEGVLSFYGGGGYLEVPDVGWTLTALQNHGFTITVTNAAVVIPTEPGYYMDREGDVTQLVQGGGLGGFYAPYIRLEPVAETVERVAQWLENEWDVPITAERVRKEFGVTK